MKTREFDYSCLQPDIADFKRHIRLNSDDIDADLYAKLKAAVISSEHFIGTIIAFSTFTLNETGQSKFNLPSTFAKLVSAKANDVDANYTISHSLLTITDTITDNDNVTIVYKAGMTYVPEDIRAAILLQATRLFNNPEDSVEILQTASQNLLRPYRSWGMRDV